jgi:hypothetical protein
MVMRHTSIRLKGADSASTQEITSAWADLSSSFPRVADKITRVSVVKKMEDHTYGTTNYKWDDEFDTMKSCYIDLSRRSASNYDAWKAEFTEATVRTEEEVPLAEALAKGMVPDDPLAMLSMLVNPDASVTKISGGFHKGLEKAPAQYVLTHEFGHAFAGAVMGSPVSDLGDAARREVVSKTWNAIRPEHSLAVQPHFVDKAWMHHLLQDALEKDLSTYSTSSVEELLGEVFAIGRLLPGESKAADAGYKAMLAMHDHKFH